MFGEIRYVTSHYNTSESASKKQIQNPVQGVENKTVLFESCTTYYFGSGGRGISVDFNCAQERMLVDGVSVPIPQIFLSLKRS